MQKKSVQHAVGRGQKAAFQETTFLAQDNVNV